MDTDKLGERLSVYMPMAGNNRKGANVLTAWIYDHQENGKLSTVPRFSNCYLDKKAQRTSKTWRNIMLEEFTGARITRDFEMRRRDGEVTVIPAGTPCVVLDVYKSPPGYEMEFDYGGEEFNIGIPDDIVEPYGE